jgi:hypothetical protein
MYEYFRAFYRAALDRAALEREATHTTIPQATSHTPTAQR